MFIVVTAFIRFSIINPLKCVWISNQECKVRPVIMNISSDDLSFKPYTILVNTVPVVITLIVHMLNYAFLMLLKT